MSWQDHVEMLENGFELCEFAVGLDDLLEMDGINGLNDYLEAHLEGIGRRGFPSDISYTVTGVEGEAILISATYFQENADGEEDDG